MTYESVSYWQKAGKTYYKDFQRWKQEPYIEQEKVLLETLNKLNFGSILEVGCGFGRMTNLVANTFVFETYHACDVSIDQISRASMNPSLKRVRFFDLPFEKFPIDRTYDLVLASEVLMHVEPFKIKSFIEKMKSLSNKYIVTLDYYCLSPPDLASHNFNHAYPELFGSVEIMNLKKSDTKIFVWKK